MSLEDIFSVLNNHGVDYVVIGGHAVNYHGYIRATEDIDIIINKTDKLISSLYSALTELEASWISNEIDPETKLEKLVVVDEPYIRNKHLMMLWTNLGYIDIFDYIPGFPDVDNQEIFSSSEELDGIKYVSLDWLLKMKEVAKRPKDILDIDNLTD